MTLGHAGLHQARCITSLDAPCLLHDALEIGLYLCLLPFGTAMVLSIDATASMWER